MTDPRGINPGDMSEEKKLRDLASYVLALPLVERREWLERWEARHGKASAERLKGYIRAEWERRKAA